MLKVVAGIHVGHQLDEGRRLLERVFAGIPAAHERREPVLQHLRHQQEDVVRVDAAIEILFLVEVGTGERPLVGELLQGAVRNIVRLGPLQHPFAQEIGLNRHCRRAQDVVDDLVNMPPRVRDVHVLVGAQQRRFPRLLLGVKGQAIRAPPNLMPRHVARRAHAARPVRHNPSPRLRGVREDAPETVLRDFNGRARRSALGRHMQNPPVGRANVFHDDLREIRRLIHHKLRIIATCKNSVGTRHILKTLTDIRFPRIQCERQARTQLSGCVFRSSDGWDLRCFRPLLVAVPVLRGGKLGPYSGQLSGQIAHFTEAVNRFLFSRSAETWHLRQR